MKKEELDKILEAHKEWVDEGEGKRADKVKEAKV